VLRALTDVEPADLRHHHVEKHQVRFRRFDRRDRLLAVRGGEEIDAFVLELLERLLDQHADVGFIVND
jgi:hypothetical protein